MSHEAGVEGRAFQVTPRKLDTSVVLDMLDRNIYQNGIYWIILKNNSIYMLLKKNNIPPEHLVQRS